MNDPKEQIREQIMAKALRPSDRTEILRAAVRDLEGFEIIGQELLVPVLELVRRHFEVLGLFVSGESGEERTFVVYVYAHIEDTDKFGHDDLMVLQGQMYGAVVEACSREGVYVIDKAHTEPYTMSKASSMVRGWAVHITGRRAAQS